MSEDYDLSSFTLFERQSRFYNGHECPYCFGMNDLIESKDFYNTGKDYGLLYICKSCSAWCGCHSRDDRSLGVVAKKALRDIRHQAHLMFDPLWMKKKEITGKSTKAVRGKAYNWVSEIVGIEREASHIGNFNIKQCELLIEACKKLYLTPEQQQKINEQTKWNYDIVMFNAGYLGFIVNEFKTNGLLLELKHSSGNIYQYKPKENVGKWINGKKWVKMSNIEQFIEQKFK